jgi:hypothetical protein
VARGLSPSNISGLLLQSSGRKGEYRRFGTFITYEVRAEVPLNSLDDFWGLPGLEGTDGYDRVEEVEDGKKKYFITEIHPILQKLAG